MLGFRLTTLVRRLRREAAVNGAGSSDAELLARFARTGEETAFELLVWRHGAMVLSVCRRILRHAEDAEDAFQAVFLVLARKAAGVSRGTALPAWLHRVAVRIALRLARSRRTVAPLEAEPARASVADPAERSEELSLLDEEINRLGERYRQAIVLCYLEGLTAAEAARRLDCPTGTVESRLAAARKKLRDRLTRRGVTASPSGLPMLEPETVGRLGRAAAAFVRDGMKASAAIVGEPPVRLAKGVLAMSQAKVWAVLAALTLGAAVTVGFALSSRPVLPTAAAAPILPPPAGKAEEQTADPRFKKEWWGEPVPFGRLGKEWSYFLAISPDGKRMLVHHLHEMLCVDLATTDIIWRTRVNSLHNAEYSPDGKWIATAEWQDGANLYDPETGKQKVTHFVGGANSERPGQLGFLPDGKVVVHTSSWSYREDKTRPKPDGSPTVTHTMPYSLIVWDPATRKEVQRTHETLKYEDSNVWQTLMGRGRRLVDLQEWSNDKGWAVKKTIRFTDPLTGKATEPLEIHKDDDLRFDVSPDGKTLLVRTAGQQPRLVDAVSGEVKATLKGHKRLVLGGAFSPDGKLIATVSGTDIGGYERAKLLPNIPDAGPVALLLYSTETGKELVRYEYPSGQYDFTRVGFSPDGKYLHAMTTDHRIVAWGQLPFKRPGADGAVGLPSLPEQEPAKPEPGAAGGRAVAPAGGLVADALDKLVESLPKSGRTAAQQIDAVYLATLGRLPTAAEVKAVGKKYATKTTAEALRGLLNDLVASPEFEAHAKTLHLRVRPGKRGKLDDWTVPNLQPFGPGTYPLPQKP
jgi:RNA polymerase sigma factor (sigma-70 family)